MIIAGNEIGPSYPPFVVAEISCNHGGNIDTAKLLIDAAVKSGADAVKFQAYTPDTITLDCFKEDFIVKDGPWKGRRLYELYQKAHTPLGWFPELFKVAEHLRIPLFASVFDRSSIDMLEALKCPAYKIASMEIVDIPLIKYVAKTCKPIIISTGMASDDEIKAALDATCYSARPLGNVAILHCISGYPSLPEEANLHNIVELRRYINCTVGISDHSQGWEIPVAATALGTCIIEKHLKLTHDDDTEDADFSLVPSQFWFMTKKVREIWQGMHLRDAVSEQPTRQFRRSLYVVEKMKQGERFTMQNVRSIRPGYGLPPKYLDGILGKQAAHKIDKGTALTKEMVE